MELTKSQQKAIKHSSGPLLIIAGAGTGKTTVLVEKIKHLIKKNLARPHEILALTFTDKAAREMEERVDQAMPYGYFQMFISTFHSFADKILREDISHIGLSPGYKLQTQAQQVLFLKNNLFAFDLAYFRPLGNPNKFVEGLLQHFSRLRDEDISPNQYIDWTKRKSNDAQIEKEKNTELAKAYNKFQDFKIAENIMDFADLIFYTLELFRKRPNILKKYKDQFKYILIDEFQDTNMAQYELIKLLAPPKEKSNLTVIGDDNQSIYKFRGASISNIMQFMQDYKMAQSIVLNENFRSNQKILDTSYRLIKFNDPDTLEVRLNISKDLKSMTGKGDSTSVNFNLSSRVEDEADYVSQKILELKKNYNWNDFAVLVRANSHSEPFVRAFQRQAVPYQFLGPGMLLKRPEVKELIAYLKVLYDIGDSASFYRVLAMDFFEIDELDLARLTSFTRKTSLSLFETVEVYLSFFYPSYKRGDYENLRKYLPVLKEETKDKLNRIVELVKRGLTLAKKETAGQILFFFLEDSGMLKSLISHSSEKGEREALNISKFFDKLKSFEAENEDASVNAVVDFLMMSMELGESPLASNTDWTSLNAVNILTVHSAKGLEFPIVFLVNLSSDRFPSRQRREQIPIPDELIKEILPSGDFHIEEERRLFYVGATRARDKIFLTSSNYYTEAKRERKISPFVYESLGEAYVSRQKQNNLDEKSQLSIFDFKKNESEVNEPKLNLNSFSFSQIETYKTCPLRYKYQYVLKIPTAPGAAAAFGETIHKVFQEFYSNVKSGEKPNFDKILEIYKRVWIPIGYSSKRYEAKMQKEGEKILKEFYDKYHQDVAKIIDLEKWFKIKIADNVFISGKIDRVDQAGLNGVEIIDYKTGKKPDERELKKSMQMRIYALAANDRGLYNKKIDNITLTFYFLAANDKYTQKVTHEALKEVATEIVDVAAKINQAKFDAHVGPWCGFCPFRINCEAWQ